MAAPRRRQCLRRSPRGALAMNQRLAPCAPVFLASLFLLGSCGSQAEAGGGETSGFLRFDETGAAVDAAEATSAGQSPAVTTPAAVAPASEAEGAGVASTPDVTPVGDEGLAEQRASELLQSGAYAEAAGVLSRLLLGHVEAGRDDRAALARWAALLTEAQSHHRWSPKGAWPAAEVTVQSGDSLIAIRKRTLEGRPGLLLCTGEIVRANRLASSTAIRPGASLRVPTQTPSMRVDLSAMWAFYCFGDEIAAAFEVGVGREGSETRPGTYTIGNKQENPMWTPLGREPVPFGDPQNPLGTRWLAWNLEGRGTSLGFHGTNDPSSVGQRVSEGCIRMRNAEVEQLFEILPMGAEVRVQP